MGSDFCSCQCFLRKPENDTNILSNSKKDFSTMDKDKRFEEESSINEKNFKSKIGDLNGKTMDTIDKSPNYNENSKKKGLFEINNSFERDNKEISEKNLKEINSDLPKNQFKQTFTFKDQYMKSNGENLNTDKKNINSSNNNTNVFNNENNINNLVQENQNSNNNKIDDQNDLNKKLFNKEEININNKIKEEEDEYVKSANDKNTKNTKNSKLNSLIQNSTNREKGNKEMSNEKEIKDSNNNVKQKEEKINKEVGENQKITTDFLNDFLLGENNEEEKEKSEEENYENNNNNDNKNNNVSNDNLNYDSNSDYMYDNNNKEEGSHSSIFD